MNRPTLERERVCTLSLCLLLLLDEVIFLLSLESY
jgi:hypothetical protein